MLWGLGVHSSSDWSLARPSANVQPDSSHEKRKPLQNPEEEPAQPLSGTLTEPVTGTPNRAFEILGLPVAS